MSPGSGRSSLCLTPGPHTELSSKLSFYHTCQAYLLCGLRKNLNEKQTSWRIHTNMRFPYFDYGGLMLFYARAIDEKLNKLYSETCLRICAHANRRPYNRTTQVYRR